jgi:hypothetical protein
MKTKNTWHPATLAEVLSDSNLSSVVEDFGCMRVFNTHGEVFEGTDGEVWAWLREEGHHYSTCRDCSRDHTEVELDLSGHCEECAETTDRRIERQRRIDEYEGRGDYLRDQQKDGAW